MQFEPEGTALGENAMGTGGLVALQRLQRHAQNAVEWVRSLLNDDKLADAAAVAPRPFLVIYAWPGVHFFFFALLRWTPRPF